jgi:hypothetical protein
MATADELRRLVGRLFLLPLGGGCLLAMAGYFPTRSLGGQVGVEAMVVAQAVVMAVVYATLVPAMRRMVGADAQGRFRIALKASVIRFLLTVFLASVVAWRGDVDPTAFLVWVGITYVVMIKVETWALIHWSKRLESHKW